MNELKYLKAFEKAIYMMNYDKRSVTNKQWDIKEPEERRVLTLIQRYGMSELLARIIACKNLELEEIEDFLNPYLKNSLPDPLALKDMDKAIQVTIEAIQNHQNITVYADYDVDGATGSALLRRYFESIGVSAGIYIPDRIEEGYGANSEALLGLKAQGTDLILMVDCGTTAFAPLQEAFDAGLTVVVLDHHTAESKLPKAEAIVNPNRIDQISLPLEEMKYLCAAGVVFLFIVGLNRALRELGYFKNSLSVKEPDLRELLDLVALGTVCDVMPLVGLNRVFVKQGLKVLSKRLNTGLAELSDVAAIHQKPSAYHLGFMLGPRINAGGRVGKATLGSNLLTTKDWLLAKEIAMQLNQYNIERQSIEKWVLEQALEQIEAKNLNENPVLLVGGEGWHPGVIGIVASRLKEKFHKPSLVVGFEGEMGKGSGRSVPGVIMGEAMIKATHLGILEKGGGHAMAAGFSVALSKFNEFYEFLNAEMGEKAKQSLPILSVAGAISLSAIHLSFVESLEILEPYGPSNAQPKFLIKDLLVNYYESVGDGSHKRIQVTDIMGNKAQVMAFRVSDTPVDEALVRGRRERFDMVVSIKKDAYNGKSRVVMILEDIAF